MFITSGSDAGDDGPFESAVYIAGFLGLRGNKIAFKQNSQMIPLYRFNYHKIEGIELVSAAKGGVIVGTDDETMGSSIYMVGESN
ncbi:MAG: hypothetical protein ACHBN1_28110 [Heteroscytonema crispum UTEX LB 1556]